LEALLKWLVDEANDKKKKRFIRTNGNLLKVKAIMFRNKIIVMIVVFFAL
jgi:hypothetical protein